MGPKLKVTSDYSIFEMHEHNRPIHEDPILEKSMKDHGFLALFAIACVPLPNGKMKVKKGHHRLYYAKKFRLPVWYIVDTSKQASEISLYDIEAGREKWTVPDYAASYASSGDKHCLTLLEFQKEHHLNIGTAASLLGGEGANSHNKIKSVKTGEFRIGGDQSHALAVTRILSRCRAKGMAFATSTAFAAAISSVLRVPEFNPRTFLERVDMYASKMNKRSSANEYLDEIETLYNFASRKPIPLAFRAREVGRQRQAAFGDSNGNSNDKPMPEENAISGKKNREG